MEPNNVTIENLSFSYGKNPEIFRNLSLKLDPGGIYGLLGRNGAGKTTLLRLLAGLLFPREGSCRVFEFEARRRFPGHLAGVYFVAEEMPAPPLTIATYLGLYAPFYPRFDHAQFSRILEEFSLKRDSRLCDLSGGQRKKFYTAFGMATSTRLLIFDEPTNGLDIPAKSQFRKLLVEAVDSDRVIVISTHQARDLQNLIDPVLILDEGRLIFHQSMDSVNAKLAVRLSPEEPDAGDHLFYERSIGGYAVLSENVQSHGGGIIDLELLFNAVLRNKTRFDAIFARGGSNETV